MRRHGLAVVERLEELDAFSSAALALALETVGEGSGAMMVMARLLAGISKVGESVSFSLVTILDANGSSFMLAYA